MSIVHLLDEPWDSGLSHYALTLAEGQSRAGRRVCVWTPHSSPAFEEARRRGLDVFAIDHPFLRLGALRSELRSREVRILNAHTGRSHTLAIIVTRGTDAAVVRTRSDARPLRLRPGSAWLYARTRGFIASNEAILAEAERSGRLPAARAVIHQGFDLEGPFQPSPAPRGAPVGIVGRLDPVKGHANFLRAAAHARRKASELEFVVAGPEANLKISELRALAVELGLADAVRFLGRVSDVSVLMRSCRFGVVASLGSEAVSRCAMEWMASGRALVSTRAGALPEIVDEGRSGLLVPAGLPELMGEAIARLAEDPGLAAKMGEHGRARLESRFGLAAFVAATDRVYEEALSGARAEPR